MLLMVHSSRPAHAACWCHYWRCLAWAAARRSARRLSMDTVAAAVAGTAKASVSVNSVGGVSVSLCTAACSLQFTERIAAIAGSIEPKHMLGMSHQQSHGVQYCEPLQANSPAGMLSLCSTATGFDQPTCRQTVKHWMHEGACCLTHWAAAAAAACEGVTTVYVHPELQCMSGITQHATPCDTIQTPNPKSEHPHPEPTWNECGALKQRIEQQCPIAPLSSL